MSSYSSDYLCNVMENTGILFKSIPSIVPNVDFNHFIQFYMSYG